MKSLRYVGTSILLLIFTLVIAGCSENDQIELQAEPRIEGYILEAEAHKVLVAEHISLKKYEEIKNTPTDELKLEIRLIYISYDGDKAFEKGDVVDIWLEGDIATSNPAQAKAKKLI
jgi:hypothetical protein